MSAPAADSNARGFALILVVWLLVLIASISIYLIANGRAETAIAYNVRAAAGAEALADAGIARIVLNQLDPKPEARWKLDRAAHRLLLPGGSVEMRLADETLKINPNLATPALLSALLEVRGLDRAAARRLGGAMADWVNGKQPQGDAAIVADDPYRAAGKTYRPPHAPAESLDELQLVLGMTPTIFASIRPYLSIHPGAAAPEGKAAPLVIQRALMLAGQAERSAADEGAQSPAPAAAPQPPAPGQAGPALPQPPAAGKERIIAADVIGQSREGGLFRRIAVLRLEPDSPRGYAVLEWQRGVIDDRPAD